MATFLSSIPLFFFIFTILFITHSLGQNTNTSLDCNDISWSDVNTTNRTRLSEIFQQCLNDNEPYEDCPDPSLCNDGPTNSKNLGLAFGLTIGAGLATTLGALVPFIPLIRRTNTKILAIALALAGGVMLFVSFTEILGKSRDYLCCITQTHYVLISYSCFFIGIVLTILLDLLVLGLERLDCGWPSWASLKRGRSNDVNGRGYLSACCCQGNFNHQTSTTNDIPSIEEGGVENVGLAQVNGGGAITNHHDNPPLTSSGVEERGEGGLPLSNFVSNNDSPTLVSAHNNDLSLPDNDIQTEGISISGGSNTISTTTNNLGDASIQDLLSNTSIHRLQQQQIIGGAAAESVSTNMEAASISLNNENYDGFSLNPSLRTQSLPNGDVHSRVSGPSLQRRTSYEEMLEQQEGEDGMDQFKEVTSHFADVHKLRRMGLLTGLAIALHNFPEGLATFVATLSDPSFGGVLAVAIALHNIPEGICVSMPVYYATGSRWKAFLWAFLSGISEPLGALLGWAILQRIFGPLVYGLSFGIIAGMMVYVSLKELIPTAHKFDKTNGVLVAVFLVVGMLIMALSLVLLSY